MNINLISGPRNVSTALMYSFAQRNDTRVIDEPFYARYLSKTGVHHPGREEVLNAQSTDVDEIMARLQAEAEKAEMLFIKNMAHHLDHVPDRFLKTTRNIFLVRDPREMILSLIKKIPDPTLDDTAYRQQYRLFRYSTHTLRQPPIVIDSSELLKNPPAVIQKLCEKLDIPFDESMLTWDEGPISADGVWAKYWYKNVHESMGFNPYSPKEERFPERLEPLLENCQNYYGRLYKHAIKASG